MPEPAGPLNHLSDEGKEEWEKKLDEFFYAMKHQIMLNSHKGMRKAWLEANVDGQMLSIRISTDELRTALAYGVDVLDKAADTAVYAFFVWDNFTNGSNSPRGQVRKQDGL